MTATVAFSPEVAWWAVRGVRDAETVGTRDDGRIEVRMPWPAGEPLVSWVLSFGPDAEVLAPAQVRADVLERIEAILAS